MRIGVFDFQRADHDRFRPKADIPSVALGFFHLRPLSRRAGMQKAQYANENQGFGYFRRVCGGFVIWLRR
jgi:hypothetical protein